jgi:hypothetical protein
MPSGFQPLADWRVMNQLGPINCDVPFQPLGTQPMCGSYLTIESAGLIKQDWDALAIVIDWLQPQGGFDFADYYAVYNAVLGRTVFSEGAFRLQASRQTLAGWETLQMSDVRLFQPAADQTDWVSCFVIESAQAPDSSAAGSPSGLPQQDKCCVRLELVSPVEGFGHALFPRLFADMVMANAKAERTQPLLNPPLVPVALSLRVGFRLVGPMGPPAGHRRR